KLAPLPPARGLLFKAFRGNVAPSIIGRAPVPFRASFSRPFWHIPKAASKPKSIKPKSPIPKSPTSASFARSKSRTKPHPSKTVSRTKPLSTLKTEPYPLERDTFILRAPRLVTRRGSSNYLLYNSTTHKLSGFDFLPTPPVGQKPMKFFYQVITTPTADTPGTTVQLQFPEKRYFFGQISEGTQRACTERGVKLAYLTDVFLTGRMEWGNNGGLIGVILTLADGVASANTALEAMAREKEARQQKSGKSAKQSPAKPKLEHGVPYAVKDGEAVAQRGTLTIHGGKNLAHTLATARRFVFRKGMPVFTREYDCEGMAKKGSAEAEDPFEQPTWSDDNIKVWAMPIRPLTSLQPKDVPRVAPQSPRKRSLDEFREEVTTQEVIDPRTRDQIIRQSVITDMFNSTWKLDALVETPLAEVKMPAVMFVRNPETRALEQYTGPAPGSNEPLPDIKVFVRQPWPGAAVEKIPPTTWCDEAVSYIVRNHDIRGKFDPKKAEELKVPKGKDFGRLTKGESVKSEDGQTITPEMVLGPPRLGKGLAIIDLPSPEYVESLISRPEWKSPSVTSNLEAFIWILGPGVGDHPRLREFVASMPQCKHTVSSSDYCPNYLAMGSIAGSSVRMAQLRRDNYPVPVHDNVSLPQPGTRTHGSEVTVRNVQNSPFEAIEPGLIIDMEPNFDINRSEVVPRFNAIEAVQRMPVAVQKRMNTIDRRVKKEEFEEKLRQFRKDLPGADAEIITLGTGSSSPSKYRNVSSTLVHVPGYGYYLLDCGENTLGQLKRVFEPEKLREVLQNLRMIWISHLHADHHLGTASVIKAWFQENYPNGDSQTSALETDMSKILKEKRLFLVSEENMIWWLEEYASAENFGFGKLIPLSAYPVIQNRALRTKFVYRHCRADGSFPGQEVETYRPRTTELSFDDESSPLTPLLREATGLTDLLTTKVSHCRGAMAVSLVFPNGFKLSFSGDCRPSPSFAAIGHGSTVLIHEATFQDDMGVSAIAKKHSTTSEALEVGRRMEARAILLTHFSQRYQKIAHVEKNQVPTKRQETVVQPEQPDIPDNEPEEASQAPASNGVPSFFSTIKVEGKPQVKVPIVAAFDYMRIRVGDMPIAQAYAPAVEKLYDILERASEEDSEKQRQQKEKQEAAKMQEKMRRKAKHEKKSKAGASQADVEPTPAVPAEEMDLDKKSPVKRHSAWSASESESGWSTSGSDSEAEMRARRTSRSPSGTVKRSS
ncbi:tRNA processing endoribonuclease Trz1, partial [Aspergillus flavus]